ncbi:MAG: WxL domain-containing protein [Solirubrobacteraceae bacterium]
MFRPPLNRKTLAAVACAFAASFGMVSTASAATASETVTAGSLSFIGGTPGNIAFPGVTLNGSDQVKTQTQAFDVSDATGSNSGWAITATSTTFTAGGTHTLSNTATTIQSAPTDTCDASSTCTLATNSISTPYVLPAGTTAPTATKMFNAAAGTGMGNQTITPTWSLAIPSTTWAGGAGSPYTSTWTFTLVSGP